MRSAGGWLHVCACRCVCSEVLIVLARLSSPFSMEQEDSSSWQSCGARSTMSKKITGKSTIHCSYLFQRTFLVSGSDTINEILRDVFFNGTIRSGKNCQTHCLIAIWYMYSFFGSMTMLVAKSISGEKDPNLKSRYISRSARVPLLCSEPNRQKNSQAQRKTR